MLQLNFAGSLYYQGFLLTESKLCGAWHSIGDAVDGDMHRNSAGVIGGVSDCSGALAYHERPEPGGAGRWY